MDGNCEEMKFPFLSVFAENSIESKGLPLVPSCYSAPVQTSLSAIMPNVGTVQPCNGYEGLLSQVEYKTILIEHFLYARQCVDHFKPPPAWRSKIYFSIWGNATDSGESSDFLSII